MNLTRETILAGIIGFALGLTSAWVILTIPQILPKGKPSPVKEQVTTPRQAFDLTLDQPSEATITKEDKVQVSGQTEAGATVVVAGPLGEEVVEAGADGKFTSQVSLEEGANEIVVTAYSTKGQNLEKTETRTVYYTREDF